MAGYPVQHHCHRNFRPLEQLFQAGRQVQALLVVSQRPNNIKESNLPGRGAWQRKHF